jgi:hypothetical protein
MKYHSHLCKTYHLLVNMVQFPHELISGACSKSFHNFFLYLFSLSSLPSLFSGFIFYSFYFVSSLSSHIHDPVFFPSYYMNYNTSFTPHDQVCVHNYDYLPQTLNRFRKHFLLESTLKMQRILLWAVTVLQTILHTHKVIFLHKSQYYLLSHN